VDTLALTSALTFTKEGPNADWLILDVSQSQMVSGFKTVPVKAKPPFADAELAEGGPIVMISTIIEDHHINGPVTLSLEKEYELEIF